MAATTMAVMWVSLLLTSGCGRTPGQFLILKNQVPAAGCVVSADTGALYRGQGTLDLRLVNDNAQTAYLVFPLLENDLPGPTTGALSDPNRVALSGFEVRVELPAAGNPPSNVQSLFMGLGPEDPLLHYQIPWSGSVSSAGGHTAAFVEGFPTELAKRIRSLGLAAGSILNVDLRIRALGDRLTGSITSDDFVYPVAVCDGCLVASVQTCPVKTAPALTGNFCNIAQDDSVDCCTNPGALVCPAQLSP